MPKLLVCQTHCSNEFMDACAFAAVEFTPELIATIQRRAAMLERNRAEDSNLATMDFYDLSAQFFDVDSDTELGDRISETLYSADADWIEIEESIPEEWIQRTECDRFVIAQYEFWFQGVPKHGDYTVETRGMAIKELESLAAPQEAVHA